MKIYTCIIMYMYSEALYMYHNIIVGIFCSAKVSFFCSVTRRNENWTYVLFRQNGCGLSVCGKTELKPTKSSLSPKKTNFFPTKYTSYTVLQVHWTECRTQYTYVDTVGLNIFVVENLQCHMTTLYYRHYSCI